jgi:hypothetical protein
LEKTPTTEERKWSAEPLTNSAREVPLPGKLSLLRQKLGQKAKQEPKGADLQHGPIAAFADGVLTFAFWLSAEGPDRGANPGTAIRPACPPPCQPIFCPGI